MGICTSTGVIRDFAGPYFVSVSRRWIRVLKQNLCLVCFSPLLVTFELSPVFYSSKFCKVMTLDVSEDHRSLLFLCGLLSSGDRLRDTMGSG